jgi:hypothetical protein
MAYLTNTSVPFINCNVAVGYSALFGSSTTASNTGNWNTCVGYEALKLNSTGSYNTCAGYQALFNNSSGNYNTAFGMGSLYLNTTGYNNVANGSSALKNNTTGNYNTATGFESLLSNISGSFNTAVGVTSLKSNSTGTGNAAFGQDALFSNTTGSHNTALGVSALNVITTGNNNTAIGYNAGTSVNGLSNTSALGYGATVTSSNSINIGNSSVTWIGGQVGWSTISDQRFKRNIQDNVPGLEFIMRLKPVTYQWDTRKLDTYRGIPDTVNNDEIMQKARADQEKIVYTGFLAQQVEEAAAETGYNFSGVNKPVNDKTPYSLTYESFTVPLVKAVQEQQKIIESGRQRMAAMESRISELEQLIMALQEKLAD